ncbi:hypothetical protein GGS26DRAFT_255256 [Hypomontagnella submonticulosa]|nr:hypothetical protein GGS26DRAFT_255256 [Hypomontagnella submonticulosa]
MKFSWGSFRHGLYDLILKEPGAMLPFLNGYLDGRVIFLILRISPHAESKHNKMIRSRTDEFFNFIFRKSTNVGPSNEARSLKESNSTLFSDSTTALRRNTDIRITKTPSEEFPPEKFGMFIFQDQPEDSEYSIDIVAVHGLGGHYEETWTAPSSEGKPCNWLKDLLPIHIPHARIMSFGYNSAVAASKSIGDISTFAEQLLTRVLRERNSVRQRDRPIIFIGHSLGGIVVKKMLIHADVRRTSRRPCAELLDNVKGILFMSTPHRGSHYASIGSICANMLEAVSFGTSANTALVHELRCGSKTLQEISNAFAFLGADMRIYTFIENCRMEWLTDVVVTEDSARLNVRNEDVFHIDGNHRTMCRFRGETQNYKDVVGVIRDLAKTPNSEYLPALGRLESSSSLLSQIRKEITIRIEDFDWFFESPEFEQWQSSGSAFLSLFGPPDSGKTFLSIHLQQRIVSNQTYNTNEDIAIYLSLPVLDVEETPEIQTMRLLGTLISQLLRKDNGRLKLVFQRCPLPELSNFKDFPNLPLEQQPLLNKLWETLSTSVTAVPSRQIILIIDGIDSLKTEQSRQIFLRNLIHLHREASSIVAGFKILITSRPLDDIKKELVGLPSIDKDKERQQCLQTLRFKEFSARRDRVEDAHPGTAKWLAKDNRYMQWEQRNDSQLLVIRGKPGSGKSTLAKSVLQSTKLKHLSTTAQGHNDETMVVPKDVLVADYFYSARGGQKGTSHTLMLQSLLYQLLDQDDRLFPIFRDAYRAQRSIPGFTWQYEDLKVIFESLPSLKTQYRIYIFLDAMDESSEQGRSKILSLIVNLCAIKSACIFKCLIATRPLPTREINEQVTNCHLIIMHEKNRRDIKRVIKSRIGGLPSRPGGRSINFKFAHKYIEQHSQGVFLWVALVLEELKNLVSTGPSQKELDDCLRALPLELEDMYKLIVERLASQPRHVLPGQIDKARQMLNWVTFAERPLRVKEFVDAISIPPSSERFSPDPTFLTMNRVRGIEDRIKICCGPLLETRSREIQLLHLTAREFLLRENGSARPFNINEKEGYAEITIACLRYLQLLSSKTDAGRVRSWRLGNYDKFVDLLRGFFTDFPLLRYIIAFLPRHLEKVASETSVHKEFLLFLRTLSKDERMLCLFSDWARPPGKTRMGRQSGCQAEQFRIRCLIAAARKAYRDVVKLIMALHTDINGIDTESGTFALLTAVHERNSRMAQLLIDLGADVNQQYGDTPLIRAAKNGALDMIRLFGQKADAELRDTKNGWTALMWAGKKGDTSTVMKLLEDCRANADAKDDDGRTALSLAAERGHEYTVRLLLRYGADPNTKDKNDHTPSSLAFENGHDDVARLLLDNGAHPIRF